MSIPDTAVNKLRRHLNNIPFLILTFDDVEHGEDGSNYYPKVVEREVTSRTDPARPATVRDLDVPNS